jgi:hypothetical protein
LITTLADAEKKLELLRLAYTEDVKHLDQHEWRYVDVANEPLSFSPADVAFVIVDTSERAAWWNKALHGGDAPTRDALWPYGAEGVYAVSLDLIIGRSAQ